jgi:hypothetical protein
VLNAQGPNSEGGPSSAPANGPIGNYLHADPYPNTGAPGQPKECEAANETGPSQALPDHKVIGNVPGNQGTAHDTTKIDQSR